MRDTTGPVLLNEQSPDHEFVATFPRWIWYPDASKPRWVAEFSLPEHFNPPCYDFGAEYDCYCWLSFEYPMEPGWWFCDFVSWAELAYHSWEVGVRLENVQPHPSVYSTLIRKAINFWNRRFPDVPIHPGIIKTTCLGNGKTHPGGYIAGAESKMPISARKSLALAFQQVAISIWLSGISPFNCFGVNVGFACSFWWDQHGLTFWTPHASWAHEQQSSALLHGVKQLTNIFQDG